MNAEIKASWIEALESGRFKHGTAFLKSSCGKDVVTHCAAGVLCELHCEEMGSEWEPYKLGVVQAFTYQQNALFLPANVRTWAGLAEYESEEISYINDHSTTYKKAIKYIKGITL